MEINKENQILYIKNEPPTTDVQNIEQKMIEHIQQFCHKNGYVLVLIQIQKL
jgi:hypothetical protein